MAKDTHKQWMIVCGATFCSLWLARNESIFNSKVCDRSEIFFLIKIRSMLWVRAYEGIDEIDDIRLVLNPKTHLLDDPLFIHNSGSLGYPHLMMSLN